MLLPHRPHLVLGPTASSPDPSLSLPYLRGEVTHPRSIKLWRFPVTFKDLETGASVRAILESDPVWDHGRDQVDVPGRY